MATITTPQDVRDARAVALNLDDHNIQPYIEDAEKQDVLPVLGASLYFAIIEDKQAEKYKYIIDGGTFNDGRTDRFSRGLRVAVAYLAYSRLLIYGDIQVTAYGAVLKTTAYSAKPSEVERMRAADSAKKLGLAVLADIQAHVHAVEGRTDCKPEGVGARHRKFVSIRKKHV